MLRDLELECHNGMFSLISAALVSSGLAPQLRSLCLLGLGAKVPPPTVLEELAALESFVLEEIERWCRECKVEFVVYLQPRRPRHVDWI
ncbi:hypothetical protein FA95DRAFT_1607683 [Auriscalpium vulgare]|uniref:Uncharacterized protein n=1 Tax=Auriscalpium vulgare TaxID=40419 RepID=A0ACB8RMU4_9AGAM|nr:hypothetical protein FA95DRAFT_1607683 [Auriscalpium vulgare]